MRIRNTFYLFCFTALLLAASCSSRNGIERMAMERLPIALEKALGEKSTIKQGARIQSPETLYKCDSLCIILFKAVGKDPDGNKVSIPVRYVYLCDVVLSAVKGHPVYSELVNVGQNTNRQGIRDLKKTYRDSADDLYLHYVGIATPIDSESIW